MIRIWIAMAVAAFACAQPARIPTHIEGAWQGTLNANGTNLRVGIQITGAAGGAYTSKLDSIDQGRTGIAVAVTTFSKNTLHFEVPDLHMEFTGTLSADGTEISGTFTQIAQFPLTFKRVSRLETLRRPQTPKPPFPYDSLDVTYPGNGVKLAGTLTIPNGAGPFPAAILISGSGPQDRDETIEGHKSFLVIADYLARRGIAVLRVDDRGVGQSTGSSTGATMDDMAGDVLSGVRFLKTRKAIDARHIGVIGHSEGGIVAPLAASRSADVAFVVMLAGPGVKLDQLLYKQGELMRRSVGASDAAIAEGRAVQELVIGALQSEPDPKAAAAKIRASWAKMKAAMPPAQREQLEGRAADAVLETQIAQFNTPEIRSILAYDPAATLRKLRIPVLALNGSRDIQVSARQNLPPILEALSSGGDHDFTVAELPGLNHLFQRCRRCTLAEYGRLTETFSPEALEIIGDWLVQHTRGAEN